MSQPRNTWKIKIVLALGTISFLGASLIPIIGSLKNPPPSTENTPVSTASSEQLSQLQDQAKSYELVLQREPENQTALNGLLQVRLQLLALNQGDIKAVIEPLEKLTQLNPERSQYGVLLAEAKQQIGDQEGSAQAYRSVLTTNPGELNALRGLVALLLKQQRPDEAVSLLEDTLSGKTTQTGSLDRGAVQVLLGTVHVSQKRYGEATSIYEQAIKNDPQDFRPVLAKALLLREQGKPDEAQPLFDNALALAPAQYKDQVNRAIAPPTSAPTPSPTKPGE
ncbi:tetratricopeptide repeat protein [Anabaenopsis tanganyikae CS-531]|uniref:Tetratricopeptide repeat protein n=2 Tax=Anabaenopsis TaxID=110103 RepID=A0ABT5AXL7_9CYAN|nr:MULTISPECIES: tetratricopeptide repeat protein [Anabaenopsis]MDB9541146.1 tetratricopeptide repeat protein [Anabaenopsis arnoldii]MDH6093585.1 tetratricopeptide repeat protein [Anabaenopsis arnoldii]MDH6104775.1 tetratricopeptide repeat protein [Anabaenopsis tanganyikae CS-531]